MSLLRGAELRVARRRSLELLQREPALRELTATRDDLEILGAATTCIEQIAAACARYAARPCLGMREPDTSFRTLRYDALWRRIEALATGWSRAGLVRRGSLVGLCGFASIDWIVADLACLYLGATSVPLQSNMAAHDLDHILRETEVACVVCSACDLAAISPALDRSPSLEAVVVIDGDAVEPAARRFAVHTIDALETTGRTGIPVAMAVPGHGGADANPLVTIMYTSGSTGLPKGVMYPESRWTERLRAALGELPMPVITVGYLPLAHMAGRLTAYRVMMRGGTTYFVSKRDMSTLFDDIRCVRPTVLLLVPRVSAMIHQHFQAQLVRRGEAGAALDGPVAQQIMAEMRHGFLGDRLCRADTGAAPTAPEVLRFLERCFEISVLDAYGATELGLVTVNSEVQPGIRYKLVDVPELGYRTTDQPYPRGELMVKSPLKAPGYFKNADATERLRDADGYAYSGDIVEERGHGQLVWIDRKTNILRLAQGEFVSTSQLEELFSTRSPFIDQMFVYGNPLRAYLVAVIVPSTEAVQAELGRRGGSIDDPAQLKRLLRADLERVAHEAGLRRHEVPRDFVVEREPFSFDNQLLTESNKPRRPRLKDRYGARLEELYARIEAQQLTDLGGLVQGRTTAACVDAALAVALGLPTEEIAAARAEASFVGLGGDSLGAVRLAGLLEEVCHVTVPLGVILDRHTTVAALTRRVEELSVRDPARLDFAAIHGAGAIEIHAGDLRLERFVAAGAAPAAPSPPRQILLTGASGFLGRFLLLELLEARSLPRVVCVVRGADDAAAAMRVRAAYARGGDALVRRFDDAAAGGRLAVHAGDLMRPDFGLAAPRYAELADQIDAVLHGGALVNHALSYAQLFEPNVLGGVEVMRFAVARRTKAVHFVSTIGVAAGAGRAGPVREHERAAELSPSRSIGAGAMDFGVGYSTSKWACEVLLDELARRDDVPVTVYRCGMIMGHRDYPAQLNDADMITRLFYGILRTGIAPASFYAPAYRSPRHFDGIPVDVVAAGIAGIAAQASAGHRCFHVSNAHTGDGVSLDRFVDWAASAGHAIDRLPYAAWFAELGARLGRLDEAQQRRSPLAVLARWRHPARDAMALQLDTTGFDAALRALDRGLAVPVLDEAYVHRMMRAIAESDR